MAYILNSISLCVLGCWMLCKMVDGKSANDFNNITVLEAVYPKINCREKYKVHAYIDRRIFTNNSTHQNLKYQRSVCVPDFQNYFCYKTTKDDWKSNACLSINATHIECGVYQNFRSYEEFFNWKVQTVGVKIEAFTQKNHVVLETNVRAVTPLFACKEINTITSTDEMFLPQFPSRWNGDARRLAAKKLSKVNPKKSMTDYRTQTVIN